MNIIKYSGLWLTLSFLAVAGSLLLVFVFGLRLSADFVEGSLYEMRFPAETVQQKVQEVVSAFEGDIGTLDIKPTQSGTFVFRLKRLDEVDSERFLEHLRAGLGEVEVVQDRRVSPIFAETFRERAVTALLVAAVMIVLYIAFSFRGVSRGIASWKLGVCAVIALAHNVIITVGIFVVFGLLYGVEIDALFVSALLAVMGYSVNDTIVVFDRIRENLTHHFAVKTFSEVVNDSLNQTLARSINTGMSVIIVLVCLLIWGPVEIYWFNLALLVGILIGTYSSILMASPLLVVWQRGRG